MQEIDKAIRAVTDMNPDYSVEKIEIERRTVDQRRPVAPVVADIIELEMRLAALIEGREDESESLGIPTWLYGHEPPNPFATKIAKYARRWRLLECISTE